MIDNGDGWWGTLQWRDPMTPVWVDLRRALPPQGVGVQDGTPMRVRAAAVDVGRQAPGWLAAWQCTHTGDWYADVRAVELVSRNGRGRRTVAMLVPAAAVRPRDLD